MTTMDSDSESQDSDDGRRFRFEATRKDSTAPPDTTSRTKSSKKRSKHRSPSDYYRDGKERSKYESSRRIGDKYLVKHSKHDESKSSRKEGGKISRKDYKDSKDISDGSIVSDRGFKDPSEDTREKIRDSKRQWERDRSTYKRQRSRERSYERNYDQRSSNDKHRNQCRERHRYHSRDKSRDRSYQTNKIKPSNNDRSREDHGKHDSFRKLSVKDDKSQNSRDYSSPRNVKRPRSDSEVRSIPSNEDIKKDSSIEVQDCKDLDLSEFDVLSETDENMSDLDPKSQISMHYKTELKKQDFRDQSELQTTKQARKQQEKQHKVKTRNNDPRCGSSNNNPSAVSDSSLSPTSSRTISVERKTRKDLKKEKSEHCQIDKKITCSNSECSDFEEKYLRHSNVSSDETEPLRKETQRTKSMYSTSISAVKFTSDCEKSSNVSPNTIDSNHPKVKDKITIVQNVDDEKVKFIGPCLPRTDDIKNIYSIDSRVHSNQNKEREYEKDYTASVIEAEVAFGPALPPHLLQQKHNDSQDRIIGPILPAIMKPCKEVTKISPESDDECAIGPLPMDHPALRNSRVHEELDIRAQQIRDRGRTEEVDGNKREEWMIELPPAQAANLGLGPRKFKLNPGPDMSDRSCWTDTPVQKAQKQKDLGNMETRKLNNIEKSGKNYGRESRKKGVNEDRKHKKSLLEMHQSEIMKKRKKEEKEAKLSGVSTRRPFDRDTDLQVNRFDQGRKKTILMKAQLLDDRFSRGQI